MSTILTDEQELAASRREGSLLLSAGAGSGKTSVLVERFVRAVREDGLAPGRILAITFTERAAGELRERVRARLLELGEQEHARAAEGANVSTFHGFCARLLRNHPLQCGLEPGFQIADESLAGRLRLLAFRDALARFLDGEREQAVDLAAIYGADGLQSMVLGVYAQLRSQGQSAPKLPPLEGDDAPVLTCRTIGELLESFGQAYESRKREREALDFDDLELRARDLLNASESIRNAWSERFEMLMVDELQDTNARQLEILSALDRDNLFTVGDEFQSIYGFRHADVTLFCERRDRLSRVGASLQLTRNFRSRPAILAAVGRLFGGRLGESFVAPRASRPQADAPEPLVELLLTDKQGWPSLQDGELAALADATPWRVAESRLLAARVAELIDRGQARPGEIAVLVRALGDLPVYESALRRLGIPTLAAVGGFWADRQVGDLLAWLRALANPLEELALYETLASPLVGLSSDGLALIALFAREGRKGVWETIDEGSTELQAAMAPEDRARLCGFAEMFAAERGSAGVRPIAELLRSVITATEYEAYVLSCSWGERRLANVQKLIRLAHRYEALHGRDLRGFLDHVAHLETAKGMRESDAPVADGELDAVHLMSIHAAKGLEFPVVCVADLGREPRFRAPDLLVEQASTSTGRGDPDGDGGRAKARIGLRMRHLAGQEPEATLDYEKLCEGRKRAEEREEDRVLYVACTRARERLLLSGGVTFARWPAVKQGVAPIAWLAPALVPDVPTLAAAGDLPPSEMTIDVGDLTVRCVFNSSESSSETGSQQEPQVASQAIAPADDLSAKADEPPEGALRRGAATVNVPSHGSAASDVGAAMRGPLSDPDMTMSYSALAELERCGYRFYLERVLRMPENRAAARSLSGTRGLDPRTRGTIVHALLEGIDFSRPRRPSQEDVTALALRMGIAIDVGECMEIARLIDGALQSEPARRLAAGASVGCELAFAFSLAESEPLVNGVLDLVMKERDGTVLIVDYKSDRLEEGEDLEDLVRRDYGFQRTLYALAALEHDAGEVEVAHWFLERPEQLVSARFQASQREEMRTQLLERVGRLREKGFAVSADPHRELCLTCPGRSALCSWGKSHTSRERSTTLATEERRTTLGS